MATAFLQFFEDKIAILVFFDRNRIAIANVCDEEGDVIQFPKIACEAFCPDSLVIKGRVTIFIFVQLEKYFLSIIQSSFLFLFCDFHLCSSAYLCWIRLYYIFCIEPVHFSLLLRHLLIQPRYDRSAIRQVVELHLSDFSLPS